MGTVWGSKTKRFCPVQPGEQRPAAMETAGFPHGASMVGPAGLCPPCWVPTYLQGASARSPAAHLAAQLDAALVATCTKRRSQAGV